MVKVKIEETKNEALGDVNIFEYKKDIRESEKKYTVYDTDHDTAQYLHLSVTTVDDDDEEGEDVEVKVGDKVGVIQTLLASTRLSTYEDGGELHGIPGAPTPCLDAKPEDEDTDEKQKFQPFYDEECFKKPLPTVGKKAIVFKLQDNPSIPMPSYGVQGQTQYDLQGVFAAESFLITLWNETKKAPIKQWIWGYSYTVDFPSKRVVNHLETEAVVRVTLVDDIPLEGPVANDGLDVIWTPNDWSHDDETFASTVEFGEFKKLYDAMDWSDLESVLDVEIPDLEDVVSDPEEE